LGFRRLAIIDLDTGAQPMSNKDGSVWVVFNGEIYNYQELRVRLETSGHSFRTESDTETIVHLYEEEGADCFAHLNGMFAIAIWDAKRQRLVLGRDRVGQKPLVYSLKDGRLAFASELKSLLQIPGMSRELDPIAIDEYLTYQYVPHPRTIFRSIRKLPPGCRAVYENGRFDVHPYWQPDLNYERSCEEADAIEELQSLMESSVRLRMRSDVPLGAFLSGGVDSSLVTAIMQRHSGTPVKTFSIGFAEKPYDESEYAQEVADHLGTEHSRFQVNPSGVDILSDLLWHFDEPFADSSAIPTWYVSQLTAGHVTVALSGDAGDELFAGYSRYHKVALSGRLDRLPPIKWALAKLGWLPKAATGNSLIRRAQRFSNALQMPPERRYLDWVSIFKEQDRTSLFNDDFAASLEHSVPFEFLRNQWNLAGSRDPVTCASLTDLTTYLPCALMTKVDIASMAHSLECRQPFLDYRLIEFAASLPLRLKYRFGQGKRLLRSSFGHMLPERIWQRKKMGFGVPLERWFRDELREMTADALLSPNARCLQFIRADALAQLNDQH
jgi:asparagine synthase (glutamine-hydrolysing)